MPARLWAPTAALSWEVLGRRTYHPT